MTSISNMFKERDNGPYSKPLKVKVVARSEIIKYSGADGTEKQSLAVAATVIKVTCYDCAKYSKLAVGNTVILRDVIRKKDDDQRSLVITKASKVFMSIQMDVPDSHRAQGCSILNPPPAETMDIAAALNSPLKKRLSECGKIVQEEDARTVQVKGTDVKIKTVTLEDASGKAEVTLWREVCEADVRPGDFVTVTDVVVSHYKNESSLSTTSRTAVTKSEAPLVEKTVLVIGVSIEDDKAELLLESEDMISVLAELLMNAMPAGVHSVEQLTSEGAVKLDITFRGSDVSSVAIVEMNCEV